MFICSLNTFLGFLGVGFALGIGATIVFLILLAKMDS